MYNYNPYYGNYSNYDQRLDYYNHTNNNYNQPTYTEDANPDSLFDVYNGFIRGNMFKNLHNTYKLEKPYDVRPLNKQAQDLIMLDAYSFAAHDIALYLDIYPEDQDMIKLFNEYKREANRLTEHYENTYGPLFPNSNKEETYFNWINSPWPWEN